jgi:uncharacterized protein (TIGR02996 family)
MAAIEDLFAQVYEHPDDDEVRLVLADALLAAGDPRGELIQLQFHPEADHERRTMELLQHHGLTWLGALRDHVVPIRYERGFVTSCVATNVDDIVGAPEWATIRTVELMCTNRAFLLHPAMRSLRRIHGIRVDLLQQIALDAPALAARIEALRVMDLGNSYTTFARFPALREVAFDTALALRRDDHGQLASLEGWFDPSVVHLLETLPADTLTRVALRGMHHVPGLPEALARHPRAVIDQRARIRPPLGD